MIRNEFDGVVFYTFNNLAKFGNVRHLFSTRLGGVSTGKFASLNLSYNKGDSAENVTENFKKIAQLGFPLEKMVFSDQVHQTVVKRVFAEDCGKGVLTESDIVGVDGLMTNASDVVLVTFYADCVPLYFFDPVKNAIALVHAGWRGTLMEIGKITIEQMQREFGCCPSDILAGIGPSICGECFEVGDDVADLFADKFGCNASARNFIDLWEINKQILIDAGVPSPNIELPDVCTKCNPDVFYSHREMGYERGSLAAFLSISS